MRWQKHVVSQTGSKCGYMCLRNESLFVQVERIGRWAGRSPSVDGRFSSLASSFLQIWHQISNRLETYNAHFVVEVGVITDRVDDGDGRLLVFFLLLLLRRRRRRTRRRFGNMPNLRCRRCPLMLASTRYIVQLFVTTQRVNCNQ